VRIQEVIVLDEAADDLQVGKAFYDEIEYGVGDYFIDCLLSDIAALKMYAGIHSRHFGFLRMLSKRFPFCIYYEIEDDIGVVVAILDMRMNPESIRSILQSRE